MLDRPPRLHLGVYRTLLHLYPPSFRREYGHLMTQAFSDRFIERGGRRTWLLIVPDLWFSIPKQILEVTIMDQRWIGVVAGLATVAVLAALGLGLGSPLMLIAGAVALVGALIGLSHKAADRPTEYLYGGTAPKPWKWWTVLAMLLAVVYVLAAIGQLIDDPKATNVGALAIMLGFAGMIVFGLRLRGQAKIVGNWLVIFAAIPALMFFWVIVPALVGLAIIAGAVSEIVRATPSRPLAT